MSSEQKNITAEQPSDKERKSFYIETYGCQMNEYDSLIARNLLEKNGGIAATTPEDADLILLNTCAIRENAHEKVFNRLKNFRHLRRKGSRVGVLGCMPQNLRSGMIKDKTHADFIMGPDAFRDLPAYLGPGHDSESPAHLKLSRTELYEDLMPSIEHHLGAGRNKITAFVTIQRGCDNFCAFCVVPYTRGRERSRSPESVIEEIKHLVDNGIRSIVLLGQNVNSYRHESADFTRLVERILNETSLPRLYFTSPHPKDFPDQLIDLMAAEPRFCNQAHIPLQAGNNEVLQRMKRNYTRESFLELIQKFREKVPDVAISTDVIVGFPGETEEQFVETLEVMREAAFDSAFMFAYSKRKGTIAGRLYEDNISEEIKKKRLEAVIKEQLDRSLRLNRQYIGRQVEVMIEGASKRSETDLLGRMTNGRKVVFSLRPENSTEPGETQQVRINSVTSSTLVGEPV